MEQKRCAGCGSAFGCGSLDATCWCSTMPALPLAQLRAALDCLCPRCLERASGAAADAVQADGSANPDPAA